MTDETSDAPPDFPEPTWPPCYWCHAPNRVTSPGVGGVPSCVACEQEIRSSTL